MKKIITIGIIFLIVLIGIAVGYIFLTKDSDQSARDKISSLFPGASEDVGRTSDSNDFPENNIESSVTKQAGPRLQKLFSYSVAGSVVFEREESTIIRFVEQETGHVFEIEMGSMSAQRITNTTIPRIAEVVWTPDGEYVALRYLADDRETIETFVAKIQKNTDGSEEEGSLVGKFFPQGITTLSVNTTGSTFFYLLNTQNGSKGVTTSPDGENTTRVFSNPLQEWKASYVGNTWLTLLTKPSASTSGYLYILKTSTGTLTRILGNISGLSAHISPDREKVLFSESLENGISLNVLNIETDDLISLSVQTLAEKCVWGAASDILYCAVPTNITGGLYPDLWYQGRVSFSDELWKIDLDTGAATLILNLEDAAREPIDIKNLSLSSNEKFLVFTNKKDSTLWSLSLPQEAENVEDTN